MAVEAIVRGLFAAFSARDLGRAQALTAPDVEISPQGTAEQAGRRAPYAGHDGLAASLRDVEATWSALEVDPRDLRFAGQGVIAFGQARGTLRDGDGTPLGVPVIWVFERRDGLVVTVRAVGTPDEAERAVG